MSGIHKLVGVSVKAHHPRGGHIAGVVIKAEHEEGRGLVLTLSGGYSIVEQDIVWQEVIPNFYVTTYCNFAHSMHSGKPIDHQCRHIPPAALRLEYNELLDEAIKLMVAWP